jgi:hypothetical protein
MVYIHKRRRLNRAKPSNRSIIKMKKILDLLFGFKEPKTSLLALSIEAFTNETHLEQIFRQGRLYEYAYKARWPK